MVAQARIIRFEAPGSGLPGRKPKDHPPGLRDQSATGPRDECGTVVEDLGRDLAVGFQGLLGVGLKPAGIGGIVIGNGGGRGAKIERALPDDAKKRLAGVEAVGPEHRAGFERGEFGELFADPGGEFGVGAGAIRGGRSFHGAEGAAWWECWPKFLVRLRCGGKIFGAVRRGGGTWWSYRGTNAEVCKIRIWRMDGRREVGGTAVAGRRGVDRLQRTARAAFAPRNGCRVASRSQFRRDAPSRIVRGGGGATVKTALGWPVFPSGTRMKIYFLARGGVGVCRDRPLVARVVELVDTQVSEIQTGLLRIFSQDF